MNTPSGDLYLNSRDCRGTAADFALSQPIQFTNITNTATFSLKQAIFTNLIPTIETGVNDQFAVVYSGVPPAITYTFDQQVVNGTDLASAFETAINDPGAFASVVFDLNTSTFVISALAGSRFMFVSTNAQMDRFYEMVGLTRYLNRSIGDPAFFPTSLPSITSDPIRLYGTNFVDVLVSANSGTGQIFHTGNVGSCIARIPINQPYGYQIVYEPSVVTDGIAIYVQDLANLRVTLNDEWGDLLRLPPNASVSLHFKLFYCST